MGEDNYISNRAQNSRRIVKNTLMLYIRTFFIMLTGLYTSRVILEALGVEDFGIYNIVGGVIILFTFLNSALSSAVQRFLNFELGRKKFDVVKRILNVGITIHIAIAIVIFILAETVGLWFVRNELNIPPSRMNSALMVYHISAITTCVNIITIPYNAKIIAYEKMTFFAYIGIVEAFMKLLIAFLLANFSTDRLEGYALLLFCVSVVLFIANFVYCRKTFSTSGYSLFWDKNLYKQVISFSGWSLLGSVANMSAGQGINVLLNMFYGVTINAAVGITNQVYSSILSFVGNFQTAFRPQIVKSYSNGEVDYLKGLINTTAKLSFVLLFIIAFPIGLNIDFILDIWLVEVPQYTNNFIQLIIIYALIEVFSAPIWMLVQATGRIRNYQIIISSLIFCNLVLSYIFLKSDYPPVVVYNIKVLLAICYLIVRLMFLKRILNHSLRYYIFKVILPTLLISVAVALPITFLVSELSDIYKLLISIVLFIPVYALVVYALLLSKGQKEEVKLWLMIRKAKR